MSSERKLAICIVVIMAVVSLAFVFFMRNEIYRSAGARVETRETEHSNLGDMIVKI